MSYIKVFTSIDDFVKKAGKVTKKITDPVAEKGGKYFKKTDSSLFPVLKTKYALGVTAGALAITSAPPIAKGEVATRNKMNLGTIEADTAGLPNQVTSNVSYSLKNSDATHIKTTAFDNYGADGELALALHELRNGGQF